MDTKITSSLSQTATDSDIRALFEIILRTQLDKAVNLQSMLDRHLTIAQVIEAFRNSNELKALVYAEAGDTHSPIAIDDYKFRLPQHLKVTETDPKRIRLIGSCLMESWVDVLAAAHQGTAFDFTLFNNASPIPPATSADQYDFQIAQIGLRSVIKDAEYFSIPANDKSAWESAFARAMDYLRINVEIITQSGANLSGPTFIFNFPVPQQNSVGRLSDRYSLENPVYFVEELNRALYSLARSINNVHILDLDQISATFGRKYFQDDSIAQWNHGSYVGIGFTLPGDEKRLEPVGNRHGLYKAGHQRYVETAYQEAISATRTLRQIDAVKLVIFDLDDTLWRGVAADLDHIDSHLIEGWPLGVLEAASYLWKRGILLAIVSKNDPDVAERIWNSAYGTLFSFDNFCVRKINWRPKAENIAEIIQAANLLPTNVLFVDDNPIERASVKQALPGIRVIDSSLSEWRRILLWSSEIQRPVITNEATTRTDMVKAQIQREETRARISHSEFIESLGLKIQIGSINTPKGTIFDRCFELINKSNQYNTTGRRWSHGDMELFFNAGGIIKYADVSDNYTRYGIVAVTMLMANIIEQFVMSCRVFGLGVETTCITNCLLESMRDGDAVLARMTDTGKNHLCHGLYDSFGFTRRGQDWFCDKLDQSALRFPSHVRLI